ncbi:hypothetical protein ID853_17750 [Xenorhabdus sp. Vera]|nr:hypothetical protein [Xenorhabdus sp. Vera]
MSEFLRMGLVYFCKVLDAFLLAGDEGGLFREIIRQFFMFPAEFLITLHYYPKRGQQ